MGQARVMQREFVVRRTQLEAAAEQQRIIDLQKKEETDPAFRRRQWSNAVQGRIWLDYYAQTRAAVRAEKLPGQWRGGQRAAAQRALLARLREARQQISPFIGPPSHPDLFDLNAFAHSVDKDGCFEQALGWLPTESDLQGPLRTDSWTEFVLADARMDGTIRFWDPIAGTPIGAPQSGGQGPVAAIALGNDQNGRLLAVSGSHDGTLRVWDPLAGGTLGAPLQGHKGLITSVALAHDVDGRLVAISGSEDMTVRIWDPVAGTSLGVPLTGHTGSITSVAIAADGNGSLIGLSGSADKTSRVWDTLAGTLIGSPIGGHRKAVVAVAMALAGKGPGGSLVAISASEDRRVRVWNPLAGTEIVSPSHRWGKTFGFYMAVSSVALHTNENGRLIAVLAFAGDAARVWDPLAMQFLDPGGAVSRTKPTCVSLGSGPSGRLLAAAGVPNGELHIWDPLGTAGNGRPLMGSGSPVLSVALGSKQWDGAG
jgi:WD40 repeat protein